MLVEYQCEICGTRTRKRWASSNPGTPRYCSIVCKAEAQRKQKPVDREWLYQKYVVEGLDCTAISRIVNRNSKRVWEWLRDYGIPTRPRGSDKRQHFTKGHPNAFTGKKHSRKTREKIRQARLKDGHVPYLKNGKHHLAGKKGADTPNWKGGVTPERQVFYASNEWKEAVKIVWQRDDAKCQRCGLDHRTIDRKKVKFHIHHIVSFAVKSSRASPDNLVLLCGSCHRFVHSRKNIKGEFIKR